MIASELIEAGAATLRTERLRLRPLAAQDWPHWPDFYASDRSRFVAGPMGRQEAWFKLAQLIGHASMRGFGHWSVETLDGGTYLGRVGLEQAEGWEYLELGWTLLESATGKCYATEAAAAVRAHAFANILPFAEAPDGICSLVHPDNAPSQAVARRLGAAPDASLTPHFPEHEVWRHPLPAEAVS
ncbi:MAG: GNAT family N-acetyltransferase [Pseudomonadota bacterium]